MEHLPGQKIIEMEVRDAREEEFEEVLRKARALDLDLSEAKCGQFLVASKGGAILGFGRLRRYTDCVELATLGVVKTEQQKGIGSALVKALLKKSGSEVYLTTVIPDYFSRFGFVKTGNFPEVLNKKMDFCASFGFHTTEIFVMKHKQKP
jgi:N-acetylglutamate synthase-like GNAT family acetyltransferase